MICLRCVIDTTDLNFNQDSTTTEDPKKSSNSDKASAAHDSDKAKAEATKQAGKDLLKGYNGNINAIAADRRIERMRPKDAKKLLELARQLNAEEQSSSSA